jgi:hypothetical protein
LIAVLTGVASLLHLSKHPVNGATLTISRTVRQNFPLLKNLLRTSFEHYWGTVTRHSKPRNWCNL